MFVAGGLGLAGHWKVVGSVASRGALLQVILEGVDAGRLQRLEPF